MRLFRDMMLVVLVAVIVIMGMAYHDGRLGTAQRLQQSTVADYR